MNYSSDLTDKQWEQIKGVFDIKSRGEHLCKHDKRNLVNGVLYVENTGCKWRQLPRDFPPYATVWNFYRQVKVKGLWDRIKDELYKSSYVGTREG